MLKQVQHDDRVRLSDLAHPPPPPSSSTSATSSTAGIPQSFLARQLPEDEARLRFIEEVDLWGWHDTLDAGRPFAEAASELSEKFPDYAALISAWGERFGETISDPVPGVHAIVEELDARGVPLFAITNFSAEFWAPFREREDAFFRRFRDIVVSGEEKLLKPDPASTIARSTAFG